MKGEAGRGVVSAMGSWILMGTVVMPCFVLVSAHDEVYNFHVLLFVVVLHSIILGLVNAICVELSSCRDLLHDWFEKPDGPLWTSNYINA